MRVISSVGFEFKVVSGERDQEGKRRQDDQLGLKQGCWWDFRKLTHSNSTRKNLQGKKKKTYLKS